MSQERFVVEGKFLIHIVTPLRGRPYIHRCELGTLSEVARRFDEAGPGGSTIEEIVAASGLPFTQVAVAVGFMKERGVIVPVFKRRHRAASVDAYVDAMVEFHAMPA